MLQVALAGCRVWRPDGLDTVEVVAAAPADRAFPARLAETLGICLKLGGAHTVLADGRRVDYPADAVCIRPPGCVWSCTSTGPAGFISVDIQRAALPRGMAPGPMSFVPADRLPELRGALAAFQQVGPPLRREEALAALVLAVEGAIQADELREGGGQRAVARARELLRARLEEPPTLDELGREAGANKFVLLRRFKRELGVTPHAYLVALRIDRARELLGRGMPPVEVASTLGFADQSHFTRAFRANVGLTPRAYALRVRATRSIPFYTGGAAPR
jgi:AraC-like DNA-binding protein